MKELFEQLQNEKEELLIRWKDEAFFENLYLDFKKLSSPNRKKLNNDDKKIIGKALSGFSNSEGGTVVWGVDARPGSTDGIDTIQELKPFPNFELFQSIIYDLAVQFMAPKNPKIEICSFPSIKDSSKGYIALGIGRGDNRPYQSLKDHCFYKRTGGSFIVMERFEIEDMFKAQSSPTLEVGHKFVFGKFDGKDYVVPIAGAERWFVPFKVSILFYLKNISGISAKAPFLNIKRIEGVRNPDAIIVTLKPPSLINSENEEYLATGITPGENYIHPGSNKAFHSLDLSLELNKGALLFFMDNPNSFKQVPEINLLFDYSCENSMLKTIPYSIDPQELVNEVWGFIHENEEKIHDSYLH
ncbi:MAG: ATP-binding protein [Proteobacteria bacterium]|nr:ATP-binding protein [Pseudomonadota bacterium]